MKAKLLKKIRKRYSIIKHNKLASNPTMEENNAESEFGLPFYALQDHEIRNSIIFTKYFKSFEEARERLDKWIISDYGEKYRHKEAVTQKLWYKK